jgi:hypothetical protein
MAIPDVRNTPSSSLAGVYNSASPLDFAAKLKIAERF